MKFYKIVRGDYFKMVKSFAKCRWLVSAVLLLVLLLALIPLPAFANPGMTVSNAGILATVSPGQTLTQQMTVSIASADPAADISVQVYGMTQTPSGGYQLLNASQDTGAFSSRTFVSVDNSSFHLEPGASHVLTVTVSVPQDVGVGGRYAMIHIATQPVSQGGVAMITAVDVPVYLTIQGSQLAYTGNITAITVGGVVSGQAVNISTTFQNTGNVHFKVKGEVSISNADGAVLDTIYEGVTSSSIIPGMSRQLQASLMPTGELSAGVYTVDSKVMLNDSTVLDEDTTTFTVETAYVPPPGVGNITLTPSLASTLTSADGKISIYFPQGAVLAPVNVSLQSYPVDQIAALPSGIIAAGTCFQVSGLSGLLAKDATITVKYTADDLSLAGGDVSRLQLARWDAGSSQWTILKTTADTAAMTLSASSNQMSIWAAVVGSPAAAKAKASSGTGTTVAAIVGAIVLVLVVVVIIFLARRRQRG